MTGRTVSDEPGDARPRSPLLPRVGPALRVLLSGFESLLYGLVGLLLVLAAVFVVIGTVEAIVDAVSVGEDAVAIGVVVLDRILLTLIVAELAYTLRFVAQTHEIVAEPFLFIGMIATVRRILIVTAEFERPRPGMRLSYLLLELGLLGLLALALAAAIFLIRLSAAKRE
ncbi:MAG: hypothetical protein GEV03_14000 [Streptosporangiales bacterium]|nr:hypothetical protein [Streptosporangiales bacterium]